MGPMLASWTLLSWIGLAVCQGKNEDALHNIYTPETFTLGDKISAVVVDLFSHGACLYNKAPFTNYGYVNQQQVQCIDK